MFKSELRNLFQSKGGRRDRHCSRASFALSSMRLLRLGANFTGLCRLIAFIMPIRANCIGPSFSAASVTQRAAVRTSFIACSDCGISFASHAIACFSVNSFPPPGSLIGLSKRRFQPYAFATIETARQSRTEVFFCCDSVAWRKAVVFFSRKVLTHRDSRDLEFGNIGTMLAPLIEHVPPPIA
jgi:hypothetical protein